jgi:hypothetical protein
MIAKKKNRKLYKLHMRNAYIGYVNIFLFVTENLHKRNIVYDRCGSKRKILYNCRPMFTLPFYPRYRMPLQAVNQQQIPASSLYPPPSGKPLWNFCVFRLKPQASTACRYFNYSRCVINNYNIYNLPFAGKLNYLHTVLHSPEH